MRTHNRRSWMLLTGFASCLGLAIPRVYALEPQAAMELVRVGDVQYLSGGVSKKERATLEQRASDFRMSVSFESNDPAKKVHRVSVTLIELGEGNRVIRLKTAGPMLLLSLPPGRYTLAATVPGSEPVQSQFDLQPGKAEQLHVVLNTAATSTEVASSASNTL